MRNRKKFFINLSLAFFALIYYLPFLNKGLILYDEGYIIHLSQRIVSGEVPYYNFFNQYTPGFFYLIAVFFKLFSVNVIVGRFVTLGFAVSIVFFTFFLLDSLKISSIKTKLICLAILISYGFPLFNVPIVVWPCILISLILVIIFYKWTISSSLKLKYPVSLGLVLGILLFTKHNLGLAYLGYINLAVILSNFKNPQNKFKNIVLINSVFVIVSLPWIYYFFIKNHALLTFLSFSREFITANHFLFPSLFSISSFSGVFKLFPYYIPIIFFIFLLYTYFFKKLNRNFAIILAFPLVGWMLTIYPIGDILHVYPFLSLTLVSFLLAVISAKVRFKFIYLFLISITILCGFYLTFFRGQYKYGVLYKFSVYPLNLPTTKGILVDAATKKQVMLVNNFIKSHTRENDYIFVFPFSPMYYFILDRRNPTPFENTLQNNLTFEQEKQSIEDIRNKNVKYIILVGNYKFNTPLSIWIQKNTKIIRVVDADVSIAEILKR